MTKNELIAAVAERTGLANAQAAGAVEATFDIIAASLHQGSEVKVAGFGSFKVGHRAEREGRDPRTGQPVKIAAARRAKFSAAKGLKDGLNADAPSGG
jgi:DNA-binding protein HU-beta